MSLNIPIGFVQVAFKMQRSGGGDIALVTEAFSLESNTPPSSAIVQGLFDAFSSQMKVVLQVGWRFVGATGRFGASPLGPTFEVAGSIQGTSSGFAVPPNVAALVQKRTGMGGRSNRGRFYFPGVDEGSVDEGGFMSAALRTSVQNAVGAYIGAAQAVVGVAGAVILHDTTVVGSPTPVVEHQVQALLATQRRRLR
jgi:hypothetical protein